jgi:hypothetical protein
MQKAVEVFRKVLGKATDAGSTAEDRVTLGDLLRAEAPHGGADVDMTS